MICPARAPKTESPPRGKAPLAPKRPSLALPAVGAEWILVGRVSKAVGLQGMLRIIRHSDNPDRFVPGAKLLLRDKKGEFRQVTLESVRARDFHGPVDVTLEGLATVDDVAPCLGCELYVPASERVAPPKGSFYPDELKGMEVRSPTGEVVGSVNSLESEVPSPYLVIGTTEHGEVYVPFRKAFIRTINRQERVVHLAAPLDLHILG